LIVNNDLDYWWYLNETNPEVSEALATFNRTWFKENYNIDDPFNIK